MAMSGQAARGSHNSSKQLAHAATRGSRVTFTTTAGVVSGYLVGMDDYHWVVVSPEDSTLHVTLVHKASSPIVNVGSSNNLQDEQDSTREYVAQVGSAFFSWCSNNFGLQAYEGNKVNA